MRLNHVSPAFVTATALLAVLLSGCGGASDYGQNTFTTTPTTTPTTPTTVTTSVGDFRFQPLNGSTSTTQSLSASGSGSLALNLQSVSGFTSPITFTTTTEVRDASNAVIPNVTATATITPSLTTIPAGNTPVTLTVQASQSLPALAQVIVRVQATGGGLNRYPVPPGPYGATDRRDAITFVASGLALTGNDLFINPLSGLANSLSVSLTTSGLSGTATVTVTGLPAGVIANPAPVTITSDYTITSLSIPLTLNGSPIPGTYPLQVTLTLNGTTYTSNTFNLVIQQPAGG